MKREFGKFGLVDFFEIDEQAGNTNGIPWQTCVQVLAYSLSEVILGWPHSITANIFAMASGACSESV